MSLPTNPITRKERYLAKIAGQGVTIPDHPITREEKYLANIAGQETSLPEYPITREEAYLDQIAKNGGDIPTGQIQITENGVVNVAKYATANVTVPTEPSIKLRMTFNNETPASADGTIYLEATESTYDGTYDIMWGDENGIMSNYSKIDSVSIAVADEKPMAYIKLNQFNAIPKYATRICAVKNNTIAVSFDIPSSKLWNAGNYGEHLYSFGALSDVHVQYQTGHDDVRVAMTYLNERESVDAICIAGDLTKSGTVEHLDEWKADRDTWADSTPVYSCVGNHEAYNSSAIMYNNSELIRKYLDSDWVDETEPYFYKVIDNDVFIFLSIFANTWQAQGNVMFSDAELAWLEDLLETYRNQRVFLFAHVPPHWETDGIKYNGFGNGNGAYSYDIWGNPYVSNKPLADRTAFLDLLYHYKNVIWFSGHSHIKYEYQHIWDKLNVMRFNNGARLVHVSSLTVPRDIIDGSVSDLKYAESEGAVVDVYPNAIRVRSRNFVGEKFLGYCEYLLDTTAVIIPPATKTVISISATKTKTAYYTDESLSTDDITVTATYSDGSTEDVSNSAVYNTSNVDIATAGTYTIGISYTYGEDTVTTSLQVTSSVRQSTYVTALDATFSGVLNAKGEKITNVVANNDMTIVRGSSIVYAVCENEAIRNKPLYARLVSDAGVSFENKVGYLIQLGTSNTYGADSSPDYAIVSSEWTLLVSKNTGELLKADDTNYLLNAQFKASSKSTATFPVTVNSRIQIGYRDE